MIRFFRSIRQNLLSEGKTGKYLKYAIGEIVLVVLGILIALQINNWSENRKLQQQKSELLASLKADAHTTEKRLDFSIEMAYDINQKLIRFLELLGHEERLIARDSLKAYGSVVFQVASFRPALAAYETALSTGNITLIKNDSLLSEYVQFKDNHDWFKLHQRISGDMVYLGSVWQFRKQLGTTDLLMQDEDNYPKKFEFSDTDFRAMFNEKEMYATYESMQWLVRNQLDALIRAKEANQKILNTLIRLQKEE